MDIMERMFFNEAHNNHNISGIEIENNNGAEYKIKYYLHSKDKSKNVKYTVELNILMNDSHIAFQYTKEDSLNIICSITRANALTSPLACDYDNGIKDMVMSINMIIRNDVSDKWIQRLYFE